MSPSKPLVPSPEREKVLWVRISAPWTDSTFVIDDEEDMAILDAFVARIRQVLRIRLAAAAVVEKAEVKADAEMAEWARGIAEKAR